MKTYDFFLWNDEGLTENTTGDGEWVKKKDADLVISNLSNRLDILTNNYSNLRLAIENLTDFIGNSPITNSHYFENKLRELLLRVNFSEQED